MASIERIKGSSGSGNASLATVQNTRSPGATTIVVDTVLDINTAGFMGSMGTPHTFTDPITSETIIVISEATAVDFSGHVDSGNLVIDTIAPGYTDAGSSVGDVVIIRPTTQYADNLAATLAVSHKDSGAIHATSPEVVTGINDTNGNELIKVTATASAVNEITLANAAVGTDPVISATGNDSNVGITFTPKGTGQLKGVVDHLFNPYKFSVYRNAAQNAGNGAFAIINFDTKVFDTSNNVDIVTNVGRFTAPVAGFYHFEGRASSSVTTTNQCLVALYKNGVAYQRGSHTILPTNGVNGTSYSGLVQLAAGDYVELYSFGSGGALEVGTTSGSGGVTYFSGFLVSTT